MSFKFVHNNFNVRDLEKSLAFYKEALGLDVVRDKTSTQKLELTWLRDWDRPYNLGDNEFHLAFETDCYEESLAKHKEMGCVCFENEAMGIYFIEDPDGYWLEIVPAK